MKQVKTKMSQNNLTWITTGILVSRTEIKVYSKIKYNSSRDTNFKLFYTEYKRI